MFENMREDQDFQRGIYTIGAWFVTGFVSIIFALGGWLLQALGAPEGVYIGIPIVGTVVMILSAIIASAYLSDMRFEKPQSRRSND